MPLWLVDIGNDVILTEIDRVTTVRKMNSEHAAKTVGRGMPLNYAIRPRSSRCV